MADGETRGDFAEADFLLRALDEGKGNEALREEMLHTLEDKWKAWREMLGQQTDAEERDPAHPHDCAPLSRKSA